MFFLERIILLLFPPTCGMCGTVIPINNILKDFDNNKFICLNCYKKLKPLIKCKIDTYKHKNFTKHCYLFKYNGVIRNKIIDYKFNNKAYLRDMFSEIFVKNKKICRFLKKYDIILSVPMTNKKMKQRGYNQSTLIAVKIAQKLQNIKFEKGILLKIKENKVQSSLSKKERIENVKNAYKIENEQIIKNRKVLIFDDIFTTGSTAEECAKTLKIAGAKEVRSFNNSKRLKNVCA